jgi:hypothetical protein
VRKAVHKVEGGKMIKIQLSERNGIIQKIKITGDFFLHPEALIEELENCLTGKPIEERSLTEHIKKLVQRRHGRLLGATAEDFAKCVLMAVDRSD